MPLVQGKAKNLDVQRVVKKSVDKNQKRNFLKNGQRITLSQRNMLFGFKGAGVGDDGDDGDDSDDSSGGLDLRSMISSALPGLISGAASTIEQNSILSSQAALAQAQAQNIAAQSAAQIATAKSNAVQAQSVAKSITTKSTSNVMIWVVAGAVVIAGAVILSNKKS